MSELANIIEDAIKELINNYKKDRERVSEKICLTENDVVCKLYSLLHGNLGENLEIHSELRPYIPKGENNVNVDVIRNTGWEKQNGANEGAKIDLAIIDTIESYWKQAFKKAKKDQNWEKKEGLKYWRILSYPLNAFRAVIEIKIKVRNNYPRIRRDIEKLKMIKKENPACLTYMVVLDRYAPFNKKAKEFLDEGEVSCHLFTNKDAGNAKDE